MTRSEEIVFELTVIDTMENHKIESGKELTKFSNRIHELVESEEE